MSKTASFILRHRNRVLAVFILLTVAGLLMMTQVKINYQLTDYLPADAPSTQALGVWEQSFNEPVPNVSVMVENLSIPQALALKARIAALPYVTSVLWLDDAVDVAVPLAMADADAVEAWYKDGAALFSVTVSTDNVTQAIDELGQTAGEGAALSGDAVNLAAVRRTVSTEISRILLFIVPLVLIVLLISTSSWFEPLLFLVTIGVAILLNEGTNLLLGQVSFVTRATSAILQLAVSMDYAVFLLHRFAGFRRQELGVEGAMAKAMVKSFPAIAASAATTVAGFAVLALMRFRIGPDMGIVLAKGVVISFLCVTTLLPVLATLTTRVMDRTHHRPLMPKFDRLGRLVMKVCVPLTVVVVLVIPLCFMAQRSNTFIYGASGMNSEDSLVTRDARRIDDRFGQKEQLVLLVPAGDAVAEAALERDLLQIDRVRSVISYASQVGVRVPEGFLSDKEAGFFRSGGYSRLILIADVPVEGPETFETVARIREAAAGYYGDDVHLIGQSAINTDLKTTITGDNRLVTVAAIVAVGVVLLLTFKSLSIPLILLLAIQGATWINLSVPYFTGASLNYIGYQIISAVQLGATVDYGILFVQHYRDHRLTHPKREAARLAVSGAAASILTPASILTIAGVMLGVVSTNGIISQLGAILGRGAVISAAMVLLVLPALLMLFDGVIHKTTLGTRKGKKESKPMKPIIRMARITMALALGAALCLPALPARADRTAPDKEEAVYVRLAADGAVKGTYVVNTFVLEQAGTVTDYGRYESVTNLTTEEPLSVMDGAVTFSAPAGRFCYEGEGPDAVLPWSFELCYTLDGRPVSALELAGADGRVEITLGVQENAAAQPVFTQHYALQISFTLDPDRCTLLDAPGATVTSAGQDQRVSFIRLPGGGDTYRVTLDARDFAMGGVEIAGVPLSLSVNLPDTASLVDDIRTLQQAIADLDDGVGELEGGAGDLSDGLGQLRQGLGDMGDGLYTIKAGLAALVAQGPALNEGSRQVRDALADLEQQLSELTVSAEELTALAEGSTAFAGGLGQLADGLYTVNGSFALADGAVAFETGGAYTTLRQGNAAAVAVLNQRIALLQAEDPVANAQLIAELQLAVGMLGANDSLVTGLQTVLGGDGTAANPGLAAAAASLDAQYAQLDAAIQALPASLSSLAQGLGQLSQGVGALAIAAADLTDGLAGYTGGVGDVSAGLNRLYAGFADAAGGSAELAAGARSLAGGMSDLKDGTGALADDTSAMDTQIQTRIDGWLAQYDTGDFDVVSFASQRNTSIGAVDFIFRADGIEGAEPAREDAAPEPARTFWQRLLALFGL